MGHEEHMRHARRDVGCAVVTVSDSRTEETDRSGRAIIDRLQGEGHRVVDYAIVPDSYQDIQAMMRALLERDEVEVIILNGGTGITRRDVTVEAVTSFFDKRLDGFGELFRHLSYEEIGSAAIMSRACAGLAVGKIIICLPGSVGAVSMAMDKIIIPQMGHMVLEANK